MKYNSNTIVSSMQRELNLKGEACDEDINVIANIPIRPEVVCIPISATPFTFGRKFRVTAIRIAFRMVITDATTLFGVSFGCKSGTFILYRHVVPLVAQSQHEFDRFEEPIDMDKGDTVGISTDAAPVSATSCIFGYYVD